VSNKYKENIHILHVDDEPDFADLTATFLERESDRFAVETTISADKGLEIVADRPPDCIVSDYNMPGTNGIGFLETVRDEHPELPFILFTGKGSEDVASDALRAGATDYIQKQSGSEQYELLANRIQNAVEQHRSKRRAAALDRIRTLVADINQSLIRASSPDEIKAQVCRHISESTPYVTACFAKVDREVMQIEPQIWAGDAAGYFEELDMAVDEDSPGRYAPGGRAFHEREIAISQNIPEDERYAKWQAAAAERGFRSLAVVPIEYQDELHGLLATFASRPNAFDQAEQELLEELSDDIGHALHTQTLQTKLEQTNDELNTILEHAPVGVILMNHDDGTFRYRRFNRRMEELSGLSSTAIQDDTPQKALGSEDGAEVANRYRECVERGEPIEYTSTFEIAGERVIRKGTVAPVTTDGNTEQLVIVVQDVTEERRQRMQLEETAARLEALFDRSPDMIDVHDVGGNILDVNRQLVERTGYDESELTEMKVWDLDTQIAPHEARALWKDMDPDGRQQLRGVYQCRDGSTFPVDVHIRRIDIEDKALFVAISRDVSERKRRVRELERYERIIDNLPVGVFRTTESGEFVSMNPAYVSICDAESEADFADVEATELWADLDERNALLNQLEDGGVVEKQAVEVETFDAETKVIEATLALTEEDGTRYLDGIARDVTDSRQREQRLEQAETLFENAQDALFLIDVGDHQYTIERVNPAYERAAGLDSDELHGKTPRDILGDEAGSEVEAKYQTCIDQCESIKYEEELPINEELTYWETRIAPVTIDGEVEKLVGATRNITDRKERERKLDLVETLFKHTEECQFIVDVADGDFELRHANEYYKGIVGLPPTESVTGQTPTELFGETGGEEILDRYRECVETRESVTYTVEVPVPEAGTVYRTILTPVVTDDTVTHIVGTARDITERKRHTEQLRALNERSQMLMTADTSEQIAEIGVEAAREILGLDASSIHLYDTEQAALVPVAATDCLYDLIGDPPVFTSGDSIAWRAYEQRKAQSIDDVRDDPDIYNAETSIRSELYLPLGDHGILVAGSQTPAAFDEQGVTLGKILAANVSSALDQVEKSDRLRARGEALTRKNERLEEFTSIVSHDLRSPLDVAEGRLALARDDCESQHLDEVQRALDRMDALIEDLLTLAREGETVTDLEPIGLAAIVQTCWTNVDTRDATLVTDIDQTIHADESRLKQVFENLVRNAVEHGGEEVTVTIGELDDGFYVEDDGPGIPKEERDDVFDAGYTTTDEGTGFGLSIVEQVVDAHGWEIHVTEGTEGGARFEVTGISEA
jgi:PAS domain S-box-containing protein